MKWRYKSGAIILIALLLVSALAGGALAEKSKAPKEITIDKKISEDFKSKKISEDEYVKYLAWAALKPDKLKGTKYDVPEVNATPSKPRKDATATILEVQKHLKNLKPATQKELAFILHRPTDIALGDLLCLCQKILPQLYETSNFTFHYTNGSDGGLVTDAPDLTDANVNGIPDYIETFSTYFEETRIAYLNMGYAMPLDDSAVPDDANNSNPNGKYDIFVYEIASEFTSSSGELYGYAEVDPSSTTSFIAVNSNYGWAYPNMDPAGNAIGAMKVTAAHEYFHAIQVVYDVNEELWWMETSATYMEGQVYPLVKDNYNYLANWFQNSDGQGLETFDGIHEFGNFIWAQRLSEDFGNDVIKEIWIEDQTSDGLTAIDNVLTGLHSSSLVNEFNKFTVDNFFLEDKYLDGAAIRLKLQETINGAPVTQFEGVWREYQFNESIDGLPFSINENNVYWDSWMDRWATDYITIKMNGPYANYKTIFEGLDTSTSYDVSFVTKNAGVITTQNYVLDTNKIGTLIRQYDTSSDTVLIIRNSGNTDTANPSWNVSIEKVPVTLNITANPTTVIVGTPTDVNFTVTDGVMAVSGATVTLSGAATGTGTTDVNGNVIISVDATTEGTITATANATGYTDGTTTLSATLPPVPTLGITANPTTVIVGIPTTVSFNVTDNGIPVNGSIVTISGNATGNGTTNATGIAIIRVKAIAAGSITATANATGYTDGTTTINAIVPVLTVTANPTTVRVGIPTPVMFNVTSNGSPVIDSKVTLKGNATGSGSTNATGIAIISVKAKKAGTITATAVAKGYIDANTTINAVP